MAKPVKITTDSTCDLSPDIIEKYGITIVPLFVEMNGKEYSDGIDVKPDDLYDYYKTSGKTARSSAANTQQFIDTFKGFVDEGYSVVHISIANFLSGSFHNSCVAAEEFPGDVFTVDSQNLSTGVGQIVLKACELAASGMEAEAIAKTCQEATEYLDVSFIVETLDYLHAGGRCSGVAKFGANLLSIKPTIVVTKKGMVVGKKYRGKMPVCREQYIRERLENVDDIELDRIFYTHSGLDQKTIDQSVNLIKSIAPFKEVIVTRAGCVISSHCGPGTGGVLFFRKTKTK